MPTLLRVTFVLIAALALAGCAARRFPYPEAPRVSAKHVRTLRAMAAEDLLCDEDALTLAPEGARLFTVEGCGRRSDYLLLCAYGHCRFREVGSLKARARFDLDCEGPVTTEHLGGNAWGVVACDRRVTYVAACGAASSCAWVPTSASGLIEAVGGTASSAPPTAERDAQAPAEGDVEAPAEPDAEAPAARDVEVPAERDVEAPEG